MAMYLMKRSGRFQRTRFAVLEIEGWSQKHLDHRDNIFSRSQDIFFLTFRFTFRIKNIKPAAMKEGEVCFTFKYFFCYNLRPSRLCFRQMNHDWVMELCFLCTSFLWYLVSFSLIRHIRGAIEAKLAFSIKIAYTRSQWKRQAVILPNPSWLWRDQDRLISANCPTIMLSK